MDRSVGIADVSAAVRSRSAKAVDVVHAALSRIEELNPRLNCFTAVLAEQAIASAEEVDLKLARGEDAGPLAGIPFAVKNLYDIRGLPTLAGSIIRKTAPAATEDAAIVAALRNSGAVLIGALNMDEFAYGFTGENSHYGPTHNPHDLARVAGGSSCGSAAAVAAGIVPLTLGTDTNGSIRVPASFCGIFGLKPTYGRLSRRGAFLFAGSLDTVGPFARSVEDLALAYDAMQGFDPADPVCAVREPELSVPKLHRGIDNLRIAIAGGYFADPGATQANEAVFTVATALDASRMIEIPEAARARAAAYLITASEGGNHHLDDLRSRAADYDPNTRTRLMAGALMPAAWVSYAQRFRTWYRQQLWSIFKNVDVILAPATPCAAIRIGQSTITLNGEEVPARANLGVFTQPISFVGLPVVTVPVHLPGCLPIGIQLIGAPYSEAMLLRVAEFLESVGVVAARIPGIPR